MVHSSYTPVLKTPPYFEMIGHELLTINHAPPANYELFATFGPEY
jgi:hypothetical protein